MHTFKKAERLNKKKLIDKLFSEGHAFNAYPFKVIWLETNIESPYPAQVLISASKKNFRKAVTRNKVKRLIREAYRFNKSKFYDFLTSHNKQCIIGLLYIGKEELTMEQTTDKIINIIDRLVLEMENKLNKTE
jgi:ribonuclease P protein component